MTNTNLKTSHLFDLVVINMGVCVLVLGKSGSGKSASLRNFEPDEVNVLNVLGKPMPFRKKLPTISLTKYDALSRFDESTGKMTTSAYDAAKSVLRKNKVRAYIVDDSTYLMQNENFERSLEVGYGKFTEMSKNFQQLIDTALKTDADTIVYLLHHIEVDGEGGEHVKTIGKMLDEKYCIEGACPIVIDCRVVEGRHVFVTKNDGKNLAKAPMDMLPDVMDNDLKQVDTLIREYWGMAPLKDTEKKENQDETNRP